MGTAWQRSTWRARGKCGLPPENEKSHHDGGETHTERASLQPPHLGSHLIRLLRSHEESVLLMCWCAPLACPTDVITAEVERL
ncbi:hypothetical protein E7T06_07625 [Deinococcus sp. Arct2-2]|nr:hypothetical protein E7T06_07625 [Deinococcus sp. Arct2-2]